MATLTAFFTAYWPFIMGVLYFVVLGLTHVSGPVGVAAKWLVAGKVVQLPDPSKTTPAP